MPRVFVDSDGFEEDRAEEHIYEWDELEHETCEFSMLQEVFDFIKREKLRCQVEITERRYAPGLYLGTDWEPHHTWKVFPARVRSVGDLWKPKLEAA
jgi:hypothetical protein